MTTKIIYFTTVALLLGLIGGVAYQSHTANKEAEAAQVHLTSQIEQLQNDQDVAEFTDELNQQAYTSCVEDAYEVYVDDWNDECWDNNEDSECRLGMFDRYDVEQDFQEAVLGCLAQYK